METDIRGKVAEMGLKELRAFLHSRNESTLGLLEKTDFVQRVTEIMIAEAKAGGPASSTANPFASSNPFAPQSSTGDAPPASAPPGTTAAPQSSPTADGSAKKKANKKKKKKKSGAKAAKGSTAAPMATDDNAGEEDDFSDEGDDNDDADDTAGPSGSFFTHAEGADDDDDGHGHVHGRKPAESFWPKTPEKKDIVYVAPAKVAALELLAEAAWVDDLDRFKALFPTCDLSLSELSTLQDCNYRTLLTTAAVGNSPKVCQYLLETVGVDPNVKCGHQIHPRAPFVNEPLFQALSEQSFGPARLLVANGAEVPEQVLLAFVDRSESGASQISPKMQEGRAAIDAGLADRLRKSLKDVRTAAGAVGADPGLAGVAALPDRALDLIAEYGIHRTYRVPRTASAGGE